MIEITVYRNQNNLYTGFDCIGHAGYATAGEDVLCAAASALVIHTLHSIGNLTEEAFSIDTDEESGQIVFRLEKPSEHDSFLLIQSMTLGLQEIMNQYGNEFITLDFEEV